MADTSASNERGSRRSRVGLVIFLVSVAFAALDGYLLHPYISKEDPAALWPSITAAPDPARPLHQRQYRFTQDWFSSNIPVWSAVMKPYKGKPDAQYLEIGTWEGRSLFWVSDNILTHPTSRLTAIDPLIDDPGWPESKDIKGTLFANVKMSGAEDRIRVIVGFSQAELRKLPLESFDIIYVDGSHAASDTLEDLVLSSRLLKAGGLLIMDDYGHYRDRIRFDRPQFSMDAFYAAFRHEYEVLHRGWQVILQKKTKTSSQ
jgi:hypothetical protein